MGSYSEIECAFIIRQFSIEIFIQMYELIKEKSFSLNNNSPGYVCGEEFEYPEWKNFKQALDQIKKGSYESFCVNFKSEEKNVAYEILSIEVDINSKCVSIKTDEEAFVNKETNTVNRKILIDFINLMQELALCLDVVVWQIAQSGFDYELNRNSGFVDYSGAIYPKANIDKLIAWYNQEYLSRWS